MLLLPCSGPCTCQLTPSAVFSLPSKGVSPAIVTGGPLHPSFRRANLVCLPITFWCIDRVTYLMVWSYTALLLFLFLHMDMDCYPATAWYTWACFIFVHFNNQRWSHFDNQNCVVDISAYCHVDFHLRINTFKEKPPKKTIFTRAQL